MEKILFASHKVVFCFQPYLNKINIDKSPILCYNQTKGNDGEETEGIFTESRGWCEAVIEGRISMAPESVG